MSTPIAGAFGSASLDKARVAGPAVPAALFVDPRDGALFTADKDKRKRSYVIAISALTLAATPTDIVLLKGADGVRTEVNRVVISGAQTTAGIAPVDITRRSADNTGGTSTAPTAGKFDLADSNPATTAKVYTANPSALGTSGAGSLLAAVRAPIGVATGDEPPTVIDFGERGKPIVLAGAGQYLAINMRGATVTGAALDILIEFTESSIDG